MDIRSNVGGRTSAVRRSNTFDLAQPLTLIVTLTTGNQEFQLTYVGLLDFNLLHFDLLASSIFCPSNSLSSSFCTDRSLILDQWGCISWEPRHSADWRGHGTYESTATSSVLLSACTLAYFYVIGKSANKAVCSHCGEIWLEYNLQNTYSNNMKKCFGLQITFSLSLYNAS